MKSILILVAACVLTSCSVAHCPTYAGANRSNNHYKKLHTAKHIKPRKSLI